MLTKMEINLQVKRLVLALLFVWISLSSVYGQDQGPPIDGPVELEDGCYTVPIKLWHAMEEKPSMGNQAFIQMGNLVVKNKKASLYVGTDLMEYMNIKASLINLYVEQKDGTYQATKKGCYEIEVPNEAEKRPRVFVVELLNQDQMVNVYVDPKVEPMGDEPIRARIKIDWDQAKKITPDQATLVAKYKEGPRKPDFKKENSGSKENKGLYVDYPGNCFLEEFSFYGNRLTGPEAQGISKDFSPLDQVNVFNIDFLGNLDHFTGKEKSIQATRKKVSPQKSFTVKLPLLKFKKTDSLNLYDYTQGAKKKIDFQTDEKFVSFQTKKPGNYVLVNSGGKEGVANMPAENSLSQASVGLQGSTAAERGKAFLQSVKKPQATSVKSAQGLSVQSGAAGSGQVLAPADLPPLGQVDMASKSSQIEENNPTKEDEQSKSVEKGKKMKESGPIIGLILLLFAAILTAAIVISQKLLKEIAFIQEEETFIKEMERKNEKK